LAKDAALREPSCIPKIRWEVRSTVFLYAPAPISCARAGKIEEKILPTSVCKQRSCGLPVLVTAFDSDHFAQGAVGEPSPNWPLICSGIKFELR
jgi:hypothetical protein